MLHHLAVDGEKPRRSAQERAQAHQTAFRCWGAASMPVAGGLALAIRLRFHNHAPQQLPSGLALHQQAADELGGDDLGGAGEEGLGEVLGGLGGYGSGLDEVADAILLPTK